MKADIKEKIGWFKKKAEFSRKGLDGRRSGVFHPSLPPSVNPLFRLAHRALSADPSASDWGGLR